MVEIGYTVVRVLLVVDFGCLLLLILLLGVKIVEYPSLG